MGKKKKKAIFTNSNSECTTKYKSRLFYNFMKNELSIKALYVTLAIGYIMDFTNFETIQEFSLVNGRV